MDTDSLAGTAPKRKAYEVGGTQPGDTQDQIERLTSALTMSETRTDQRFTALEATMEKYFQTLTAQFTQQLDSLSKALDARCKSYYAALGPASSSVTGGTTLILIMAGRSRNTTIWQWNCRGFARKRPVLQQFLASRDRPEIIALQEGGKHAQLAGYKTYTSQHECHLP
ncbi:hypothetical protein MTO96_018220 [Rhipicephalus appendiculatus]